jgi:hypothetical protein
MGAHGPGRRQVQILNRRDTCCFGEAQHDPQTAGVSYEDAMHEYATASKAAARRSATPPTASKSTKPRRGTWYRSTRLRRCCCQNYGRRIKQRTPPFDRSARFTNLPISKRPWHVSL